MTSTIRRLTTIIEIVAALQPRARMTEYAFSKSPIVTILEIINRRKEAVRSDREKQCRKRGLIVAVLIQVTASKRLFSNEN